MIILNKASVSIHVNVYNDGNGPPGVPRWQTDLQQGNKGTYKPDPASPNGKYYVYATAPGREGSGLGGVGAHEEVCVKDDGSKKLTVYDCS